MASSELVSAKETLQRILILNNDNEFALNELAFIEYTLGNIYEAEKMLIRLIQINPRNDNARKNLTIIRNKIQGL